jgi:hypothetical protein
MNLGECVALRTVESGKLTGYNHLICGTWFTSSVVPQIYLYIACNRFLENDRTTTRVDI